MASGTDTNSTSALHPAKGSGDFSGREREIVAEDEDDAISTRPEEVTEETGAHCLPLSLFLSLS
jgi:hypothetical protein